MESPIAGCESLIDKTAAIDHGRVGCPGMVVDLQAERVVHAGFDFCSRLKGTFILVVTRDIEITDFR